MTEQEISKELLREKIEHILYECNALRISYQTATDQFVALFEEVLPELAKEAGLVRLSEDQSLLPNPNFNITDAMKGIASLEYVHAQRGREDLLKAGWRKVILEK